MAFDVTIELFKHFIDLKKAKDPEFAKLLQERGTEQKEKVKGPKGSRQGRKTEKEEDQELLNDEENENDDSSFVFTESPACKDRESPVWLRGMISASFLPFLTQLFICFVRLDLL